MIHESSRKRCTLKEGTALCGVFLEHVCTKAVSTASFQVAVDFYTY